ncbi:MAG: pilin [bacterium]|nr:pilin [bacterium]
MKRITAFLLSTYYLLITNVASAALLPQCNPVGERGAADTCNLCHVLQLGKNLITFSLEIGFAAAALFIAWGAFVIMTAGDSEEKVKTGKQTMTIAVTGVVIAISAWLIIGTALQILTGSPSKLPWDQIQCTF